MNEHYRVDNSITAHDINHSQVATNAHQQSLTNAQAEPVRQATIPVWLAMSLGAVFGVLVTLVIVFSLR